MSDSTKERFYFIQNKFIWNYFYTIGDYNKYLNTIRRLIGRCNRYFERWLYLIPQDGPSRNPEGKKSYLSGSKKIKEMSYDQFLRFIFPEGMFDYFELSDFKEKSDRVEIYFEEKNIHPQEYATDNLESKGFYEQVRMQDYPMRGRSCLLFIKKRRWFNHSTGKYVSRNWKLVAEGTQITTEFASFLKALDRLSRS